MSYYDYLTNPTPTTDINLYSNVIEPVYQPFNPNDGSQASRHTAYVSVNLNGVDITDKLNPHLISVHINDGPMATCDLEIDDRDATLPIPPFNAPVTVGLGWTSESTIIVFNGVTSDFEHGFGRKQGGRRMWIHCTGLDMLSNAKSPFEQTLGQGSPMVGQDGQVHTVGEWLLQVMGPAGLVPGKFDPAAIGQQMPSYSQSRTSAMNAIQDVAELIGAQVQFAGGNQVNFIMPGYMAGNHIAQWGVNLISWRLKPFAARAAWSTGAAQFFNPAMGQWTQLTKAFGLGSPWNLSGATFQGPNSAPNSSVAQQFNAGNDVRASYEAGEGRIVMNGEPTVRWAEYVQVVGARPGVDGQWWVKTAEHIYSRETGYVTWCDVLVFGTASTDQNVSQGWPVPAGINVLPPGTLSTTPAPGTPGTLPQPAPNL